MLSKGRYSFYMVSYDLDTMKRLVSRSMWDSLPAMGSATNQCFQCFVLSPFPLFPVSRVIFSCYLKCHKYHHGKERDLVQFY